MTRPLMTQAELQAHHVGRGSRDYRQSDDGYGDLVVAEKQDWHAVANWGRDGWDLGDWPFVMIFMREVPGTERPYWLLQTCEGDHDYYTFESAEDREAAVDYLFLWYAANRSWGPLTWDQREALERGEIEVDAMWRGPYSSARADAERST